LYHDDGFDNPYRTLSMNKQPLPEADFTKRAFPETLRATSLEASLTVSDLQKSLAWYRDVVGFFVDQMHERGGTLRAVSLKAGAVRILINQDDGAKGERIKGLGFSLQLTTGQSVDEIAQRIKDHGGTLDSEPADMPWGPRMFRIRDPDGFIFTISSPRPPR
jgi:uncharacterized glyoxalase superfamily protein PhnB